MKAVKRIGNPFWNGWKGSIEMFWLAHCPHSSFAAELGCETRYSVSKDSALKFWLEHVLWGKVPRGNDFVFALYEILEITTRQHHMGVIPESIFHFLQFPEKVLVAQTPWTVACQAPLSVGFSWQEYWSGLPFTSPGDLPYPGIEPRSPTLQADALTSETRGNN